MKVKTVRAIIALNTVFFAIAAQSATYTWDGGGADNNWSDAANWNPDGAPVSANMTTVRLTGETRTSPSQDIGSPFVLNRLEYLKYATSGNDLNALVLNGDPLRFEADDATPPRIFLTRAATCQINNDVVIADDTTLFMEITTWGLVFNGTVSGGGGIDKLSDAGAITLTQANSFSGGLIVRASDDQWKQVHINASGAMGTGEVHLYGGTMNTNTANQGGLILNDTATHANVIRLFENSPIRANGTITLTGGIDLGAHTLHLRGTGSATANGVISGDAAQALIKSDTGTWTLAGANSFTGRVSVQNGLLRFGAANALAPATPLTLTGGTTDLNGYAQTIGQLYGEAGGILTSATAATLTVDQADNTAFAGRLTGALALTKSGTGSLTLNNSANTFTGDIAINGGTLVAAAPSSLGNVANIAVNSGTLELQAANTIPDTAALHITSGVRVVIVGGVAETVRALFVDGVQQPRGSYGTTASGATFADDTLFDGDGMLQVAMGVPVTPTLATWDAEGSDTRLSTVANWDGDTLPTFDGTARAVFGTDGDIATVDAAVSLYGITFNRDADFTLAAGGGAVTLREGGITAAAPTATAHTYTLAADMTLTAPQAWHIGNNGAAATTLAVSGIVSDDGLPADLTQSGNGTLILSGANTYNGVITVQTGGVLRISHPLALGSADTPTVMERGSWLELSGGINVGEPITISGDPEVGHAGVIRNTGGSNVWSGLITCNSSRIRSAGGSLDILGGISVINQIALGANSGTQLRIAEKPVIAEGCTVYNHSGGGPVIFAVAGNVCGRIEACSREMRFDVPNAFVPTANLDVGAGHSPNAYVNLNGNDQTFAALKSGTETPGERMIESATPATLTLNQNSNTTFDGLFAGAVSLVKNGTGTLTLINALTSTRGGFTVTAGTLAIAGAGSLGPNATDIAISDSGTLSLANSAALADSAVIKMPAPGDGSAKINLAAGVDATVGWLFYGDKMMRAGTHGSTASPARYKDDERFTGTGVLRVRHDKSGTLLTIE